MSTARLGIGCFVVRWTSFLAEQFELEMSSYRLLAQMCAVATTLTANALAPLSPTVAASFRALMLPRSPMTVRVCVRCRVLNDSTLARKAGRFEGTDVTVAATFSRIMVRGLNLWVNFSILTTVMVT